MIRVTVELIPPKETNRPNRQISVVEIENTSRKGNDSPRANYFCRYLTVQPNGDKSFQQWTAQDFARLDHNVWGLILFCMVALGYEHVTTDGSPPDISPLPGEDLVAELHTIINTLEGLHDKVE